MTDAALATIGITCFNAEDTIARAIKSALNQTWPNLEIVIVDDCSSDASRAIIEKFANQDSRIRSFFLERNGGFPSALNRILNEARGEFIAFFDDDDESLPERVSSQIRRIEAYERVRGGSLIACYASGIRIYPNGYVLDLNAIGSRDNAPNGPEYADYLLYHSIRRPDWHYGASASCSLMARRSVFRSVGGFDPMLRWVPDTDFAIRLALIGGHFIGTPEKTFVQYSTEGPDKKPEIKLEGEQNIVRKHRAYLEEKGRYYYALHWHKLRYWHFKRRYGMLVLEFFGIFIRHPVIATRHFFDTGPRRLIHEWRMQRRVAA